MSGSESGMMSDRIGETSMSEKCQECAGLRYAMEQAEGVMR